MSFTFDDFKKWMTSGSFQASKKDKLAGLHVETKLNLSNLLEKITTDEDEETIAKDFKKHGGTVLKVFYDDMVLIEVNSGQFTLHKYFIKKNKL